MSSVLHRTTREFQGSVNTPDFPSSVWIINPDLSPLLGFSTVYAKGQGQPAGDPIVGNIIELMTLTERNATDDEEFKDSMTTPDSGFGNGEDGAVVFSGDTTLTQDIYGTIVTIEEGVILSTAGFRIFANTGIINRGTIRNNGANSAGNATGNGATSGTLGGGGDGAAGIAGVGANAANLNLSASPGLGGQGGTGGNGTAGSGGTGGLILATANLRARLLRPSSIMEGSETDDVTGQAIFQGGSGGGSGSGVIAGFLGGGGGGGGGFVMIASPKIFIGPAALIQAIGGNGGNGGGLNAGGGGGGGGGIIALVYSQLRNQGAATVAGGNGGTSSGTGTAGASGATGKIVSLTI